MIVHHIYLLLYGKRHIQMISNDKTINVETNKICSKENDKIAFNTLKIDITIYHTYLLLYCKGHIQMMSIDSTINVETKNNRVNKMANYN